ncbi:MAG: TonB-dependent receptor [Myxococcales bacterium]|nr:TonB-dependent receptor [Myxococcales bacterium]
MTATSNRRAARARVAAMLWLSTMAAPAAFADEPLLGTIEVRGAPESAPAVADESAFATVVPIAEQPGELLTLGDVLDRASGVSVRRYGGLGDFATVSIRGSTPGQVGVFFDGVALTRARSETVNLADLPLDQLGAVEIYRGVSPLALSASALAGAVNLVSRAPDGVPRFSLLAGGGSFGTRKVSVAGSAGRGPTSGFVSATYLGSDGDFSFEDDNGTLQNSSDDRETKRRNNAFDSVEVLAKVRRALASGGAVTGLTELFANRQGVSGIGAYQADDASLRDLRSLNYIRWERPGFAGLPLDLASTGSFVFERERFRDRKGEIGLGNVATDNRTYTGALDNLIASRIGRHALEGRVDVGGQVFTPEDTLADDAAGPDQRRIRFGLAAGDTAGYFGDRLLVQPSLRWEHLRDDFSGTSTTAGQITRAQRGRTRDLLTPRLGLRLDAAAGVALKANVARAARAPNFTELFGNRGSILGNPNLDPEHGLNADLGFVLARDRLGPARRLRLEGAGFVAVIDDMIVLVQNSQRTSVFRNVDRARTVGCEITAGAELFEHLRTSLDYTYQDARDESGIPARDGNQLPGRPRHELFHRSEYRRDEGRLFYELSFIADNFLDQANFLLVRARAIHTLGVEVDVAALGRTLGAGALARVPFVATFEVRNFTDNRVEDVAGYPLPGRAFFATARWAWEGRAAPHG